MQFCELLNLSNAFYLVAGNFENANLWLTFELPSWNLNYSHSQIEILLTIQMLLEIPKNSKF